MIFVTVGTQLGFDRLVRAVDAWAETHPEEEIFVQYGAGPYVPKWCDGEAFTAPERWELLFDQADQIVSHAGMGTILKSLDHGKPLVIMPRLAALGEHRNDHQVATAGRFAGLDGIRIVATDVELHHAIASPRATRFTGARSENCELLLNAIRHFALGHS